MSVAEPRRARASVVTIVVVTFVMAAAVTAQVKSSLIPTSNQVARDEALARSAQALEQGNAQLRAQVGGLDREVRDLNDRLAHRSAQAQATADALKTERQLAGLTPASGPGVMVTLASGNPPRGADDTKRDWEVKYVDIQDVVDLLWAAGAEAVSVNHQRVVTSSSFFVAGSDLLLNGVHLTGPYEVAGIGDGSRMNAALGDPNNLGDLKDRGDIYQLKLSWQTQRTIRMPAFDGALVPTYASAAP